MKPLLTIVLVISTVIYVIVGGCIIHVLESGPDIALKTQIFRRLERTLQQFLGKYAYQIDYHTVWQVTAHCWPPESL